MLLTRHIYPDKIAREIKNKGMLTHKKTNKCKHTQKRGGNIITEMEKGIQSKKKKEETSFRLIFKKYFKMELQKESKSLVTWG